MKTQVPNVSKRNCSIDIFRLVCAALVVSIHTHPFTDVNQTAGYILTDVVTRIAVPYFFCISGYFYIKALLCGKKVFAKTCLSVLKQYVFWSAVYFCIQLISTIKNGVGIFDFLKDFALRFLFFGSFSHLWFIPALLFAVLTVTLADKIKCLKFLAYFSILLYLLGVLMCAYGNMFKGIPVFDSITGFEYFTAFRRIFFMGIPFFMMGYFINKLENAKFFGTKRNLIVSVSVFALLFVVETVVINAVDLGIVLVTISLYPLVASIFMLLLACPAPQFSRFAGFAKYSADFVYFSHYVFIVILQWLLPDLPCALLFLLVLILSIAAASAAYFIKNKIGYRKKRA